MGYDPRTKNLADRGWAELSLELEGEHASWEYDNWLTEFERVRENWGNVNMLTQGLSLLNPVAGLALDSVASVAASHQYRQMEDDIDWTQFKNIDKYEYKTAFDNTLTEVQDNIKAQIFTHAASAYALHGSPFDTETTEGWGRFIDKSENFGLNF